RRPALEPVMLRNALVARRMWPVLLSGFVEPVLYLLAAGLGIAELAGRVQIGAGRSVGYAAYVAPALLATSSMNGAIYESTTNTFWKLRYQKVYDAMLASPLTAADLVLGEICWAQVRGACYGAVFLAITVALGWASATAALLALPVVLLVGLTFSALGTLATTFLRSWQDMELTSLAQAALFLCSATFFPISVYPPALRLLMECTPLYHATALLRAICLGAPDAGMLGHAAYLLVLAAGCTMLAARRIGTALSR
ncbi:ABC transporter permease, partial [Actinospica sp.]|uniref:ABC transporter permease n=1 Tax=Actinospica sp. TaxID=1872142 RepID=UPI002B7A07C4